MTSPKRERSSGTVLWFSRSRGHGVIERDGSLDECFVHRDALDGPSVRERDRVEFDAVHRSGGLEAERVSVIRPLDWKEPYAQVQIGRISGPRRLFRAASKRLRFGRL
jgi:cold shock CspA family protein